MDPIHKANGSGRQEFFTLLLGSGLIIALGLIMMRDIMSYMDILLADETFYLAGGIDFLKKIPKGWGPSYSAWYKILHFIQPDPIRLHYLNYKILAIGLPVLIFIALKRYKVPALLAWLSGVLFLFSDLNSISWPRISHFVAASVLAAAIISTFLKTTYLRLLFFSFVALMVSYARPEASISFVLIFFWTVGYMLYKKFRLTKVDYVFTLLAIPVFAVFMMKMGIPMVKARGANPHFTMNYTRQVTAYAQHFNINYMDWNDIPNDFPIYWDEVFKEHYTYHPSLITTLKSNIPVTVRHFGTNIGKYFKFSFDYMSGVFLPDKILYFPLWLKGAVFALWMAALIYFATWQGYFRRIWAYLKENYFIFIILFFLALPSMISCIMLYPRDHYLMIQVPFFMFFVVPLLLGGMFRGYNYKSTLITMSLLSVILVFIMPGAKDMEQFYMWQKKDGPINLWAINKINEMGIDEPYTLMQNEGRIDVFLDNKQVLPFIPYANMMGMTWPEARDTLDIRMVYFSTLLQIDPDLDRDTTWKNFLADPASMDFERVEIGSDYGYLLIHESLRD